MSRPDSLDHINAFRAGYRHGVDIGTASPLEADRALKRLPTSIPVTTSTIECFCNGADDGSAGDAFRYLLSFTIL